MKLSKEEKILLLKSVRSAINGLFTNQGCLEHRGHLPG